MSLICVNDPFEPIELQVKMTRSPLVTYRLNNGLCLIPLSRLMYMIIPVMRHSPISTYFIVCSSLVCGSARVLVHPPPPYIPDVIIQCPYGLHTYHKTLLPLLLGFSSFRSGWNQV